MTVVEPPSVGSGRHPRPRTDRSTATRRRLWVMTVVRIVPLGLRCSRCLLLIKMYTSTSSVLVNDL